jgi:hypothetical protein
MKRYRAARTCGALKERFERDAVFGAGAVEYGPAATHAGLNDGLALRFGSYPRMKRPRDWGILGVRIFWGAHVAKWASLSRMDGDWLVAGRAAIRW